MEFLGTAVILFPVICFAFCACRLISISPNGLRGAIKHITHDIARRIHAYVSCWFIKPYNEAVVEKKRELFNKIEQRINSNDVRILEIGVGSGANFEFYPNNVNIQLVAVDPNQYTMRLLKERLEPYKNIQLEMFSLNYAESMKDVSNDSIDCVISTLVLCSVNDQEEALAEVKRVLKPGCPFFFMEHVIAQPGSYLFRGQMMFNGVWGKLFDGCDVTRDTLSILQNAGFCEVYYETFNARLGCVACLLRPHIFGYATK